MIFDKSPFNRINLPNNKIDLSHKNLNNHMLVLAASSAGKTKSIIEPLIEQAFLENTSLVVYDFKFSTKGSLSSFVYSQSLKETKLKTWFLNFHDPSCSIRANPLEGVHDVTAAVELSEALVKNFNRGERENSFWAKSAICLLSATIRFFSSQAKEMCTLPHCIELLTTRSAKELIEILCVDSEASRLLSPITSGKDAMEQLAGQVSSLQAELSKYVDKKLYWVLSRNKEGFSFSLNSQTSPGRLVIANDPENVSYNSPLVGLCLTAAFRKMTRIGSVEKSMFIIDEAGTVLIPGLESKIATVRDPFKIAVCLITQDYAQLESLYGKSSAQTIRGSCNTKGWGKITEGTDYVQNHFGTFKKAEKSVSNGANGQRSVSTHYKDEARVRSEYLGQLRPGEFLFDSNNKRFKQKFKLGRYKLFDLPEVTFAPDWLIEKNFNKIKSQIAQL
jgi:type IV secretory pathway TraG/TraD family ATPase VirD4